jgi:hypothetical protein
MASLIVKGAAANLAVEEAGVAKVTRALARVELPGPKDDLVHRVQSYPATTHILMRSGECA